MEYTFTKENFNQEVLRSDKPVLVDFFAVWCPPCKMMSPIVKKLSEQFDGKVKVGKVNSDEQQELASRYGIMSIPSFLIFKDGKIVDQAVGYMPKNVLEKKLQALL